MKTYSTERIVAGGAARCFFGRFLVKVFRRVRRACFVDGAEVHYLEEGNVAWRKYGANRLIVGVRPPDDRELPSQRKMLSRQEAVDRVLAKEPLEELGRLETPVDCLTEDSSVIIFRQQCDALFEASESDPIWLDESTQTNIPVCTNRATRNSRVRVHVDELIASTFWH